MPAQLTAPPALAHGRPRSVDERAAEKAGPHTAGAARQENGRRGQGEECRVAPCVPAANGGWWTLVAGALCLPHAWWGPAGAQRRQALGMPAERTWATQIAWGVQRVKRAKAHRRPCALRAGDARAGRASPWRADVDTEGGWYAAQVPADPPVALRAPRVGVPAQRGQRGRPRTRLQVLRGQRPPAGRALARHPQTVGQQGVVRPTARGRWAAEGAVPRVWTVAGGPRPRAAGLVIRRAAAGAGS